MGLAVVVSSSTSDLPHPALPHSVSLSLPQPLIGGISSPHSLHDPPLPLFLLDVSQGRCRSLPYECPALLMTIISVVTATTRAFWCSDMLF